MQLKEIDLSATVHPTLHEFQLRDLPFSLSLVGVLETPARAFEKLKPCHGRARAAVRSQE